MTTDSVASVSPSALDGAAAVNQSRQWHARVAWGAQAVGRVRLFRSMLSLPLAMAIEARSSWSCFQRCDTQPLRKAKFIARGRSITPKR